MYLRDLQSKLGGDVIGEVALPITAVGTLERATTSQITFLANPRYRRALDATNAGAVIISPSERDATNKPRIVTDNPYAYFALVAQLFSPRATHAAGVHSSAVIAGSAKVAATASIAEFVSIGANTIICDGVRIGAGSIIGDGVTIGEGTELVARVVVYQGSHIGSRGLIHAGVVIGADGFGFANDKGVWVKIPQTGCVIIGDDCEIGANTTIDRGAIENTIIGNGVKLDNQIQVGHNCEIGEHCIVAGCTGIAGSTKIGRRVMIGGAVSITGHLEICDDAVLSANAFVTKSINEPGMYSAGFPLMPHREWLKNAAQLRHLDELAAKLKKLGDRNE
ncbi:MAG: UDP-3-O-(3-hydroxymyristoyl)glucosamine N-acyltransferase [Pseudomonadota bacterium]